MAAKMGYLHWILVISGGFVTAATAAAQADPGHFLTLSHVAVPVVASVMSYVGLISGSIAQGAPAVPAVAQAAAVLATPEAPRPPHPPLTGV